MNSRLIPQKTSPSVSPVKLELQNSTTKIKIESPKNKLYFDDENTIIGKSGSKRKISPTKTPENKKIKISSVDYPDTQVCNIIYIHFLLGTYFIKLINI